MISDDEPIGSVMNQISILIAAAIFILAAAGSAQTNPGDSIEPPSGGTQPGPDGVEPPQPGEALRPGMPGIDPRQPKDPRPDLKERGQSERLQQLTPARLTPPRPTPRPGELDLKPGAPHRMP